MIKTATNIIKGAFRFRKRIKHRFKKIQWLQEKVLKHQEDLTSKKLNLGTLSIFYKRPYELLHSYKEIFEKEIYCFASAKAAPLIIDCGSNIGLSILYFKQLFPKSCILAYEPDPSNFNLLRQNIERNNLTSVKLNEAAIWTIDGEISFEANQSEASHISETQSGKRVKCVRLNNLLSQFEEVDFLKIDIEGAESQVINDSKENLTRVKNLFLEYHGKVEDTLKLNELLAIVTKSGFKVYIKNAADNLSKPFIEKQTNTIYDVQLNIFCYR
jgi:FkbM family methyltransferase